MIKHRTLKLILSEVKPYRIRFTITGVLIIFLSSIVWVRPALIQHAVDVEMANGDYEGMLNVFLVIVGILFFILYSLISRRISTPNSHISSVTDKANRSG